MVALKKFVNERNTIQLGFSYKAIFIRAIRLTIILWAIRSEVLGKRINRPSRPSWLIQEADEKLVGTRDGHYHFLRIEN